VCVAGAVCTLVSASALAASGLGGTAACAQPSFCATPTLHGLSEQFACQAAGTGYVNAELAGFIGSAPHPMQKLYLTLKGGRFDTESHMGHSRRSVSTFV
jgi:hypothetical protein